VTAQTTVESARLRVLGTIALVGIGCSTAIVLAMNVLSALLGLLDHTINKYVLGDQRWLMTVAWFIDGAAVLAPAAGLCASARIRRDRAATPAPGTATTRDER
jgi:hypothetical protein